MQEFTLFLIQKMNMPVTHGDVFGWAIGIGIGMSIKSKILDWRNKKEASKALEKRLAKKNKKSFRGWSAKELYDPEKHFRRDGRTDRKW